MKLGNWVTTKLRHFHFVGLGQLKYNSCNHTHSALSFLTNGDFLCY